MSDLEARVAALEEAVAGGSTFSSVSCAGINRKFTALAYQEFTKLNEPTQRRIRQALIEHAAPFVASADVRALAAVAVQDDQLAYAGTGNAPAEVQPQPEQRFEPRRQRAREGGVL